MSRDVSASVLGTSVTEDELSLSDNTTANSSTSAHGLLIKLDNTATNFLNGQGAWSAPSGGKGFLVNNNTVSGVGQGATSFWSIGGQGDNVDTTESTQETTVNDSFIFSNLTCFVDQNNAANGGTLTFRDDSSDTNLAVSITGSATGHFSDTSNTATPASGSQVALEQTTTAAGSGGITIQTTGVQMA